MKVCLIGVINPSRNPRLVREADTLCALGHEVRVVAPSGSCESGARDAALMKSRRWRLETVHLERDAKGSHAAALISRGIQRLALAGAQYTQNLWTYECAYVPAFPQLVDSACRESADWFIAHAHGALPVAVRAARRWKAKLGFDCEDLLSRSRTDPQKIVLAIERAYLPHCDYISVTSEQMAAYLAHEYQLPPPVVLYNVFPKDLAKGLTPPAHRPRRTADTPLRLHWFGQTIGLGRGLEEIIEVMAAVNGPVELHLRGFIRPPYRQQLCELAARLGQEHAIHFHPFVEHDEVIRGMSGYDVGLALERPDDTHYYSVTVTNKFFSYMLAGLAVLATDTPAQREVYNNLTTAAALYNAGDPSSAAAILQRWLDEPDRLLAAQQAAWTATRERYCWEHEARKLLERLKAREPSSYAPAMVEV